MQIQAFVAVPDVLEIQAQAHGLSLKSKAGIFVCDPNEGARNAYLWVVAWPPSDPGN
jgi:hypothetical protein